MTLEGLEVLKLPTSPEIAPAICPAMGTPVLPGAGVALGAGAFPPVDTVTEEVAPSQPTSYFRACPNARIGT